MKKWSHDCKWYKANRELYCEIYPQNSCNSGTAIHRQKCPENKKYVYLNMVKTTFHISREKTAL